MTIRFLYKGLMISGKKPETCFVLRLHREIAFAVFMLVFPFTGFSQEQIQKEVVVVRPYQPTIADASKITTLPEIKDTVAIVPDFDYNIFPMPLTVDYEVQPITAARLEEKPPSRLYNSHIKLGYGNYTTPYAELSINSLRNRDFSGGVYLKHHSSHGNITLDNNTDGLSGFSDNEVLLYGKRMFRESNLWGRAGMTSNQFNYYGYDTTVDTVFDKNDIRQNFLFAEASIGLESTVNDSSGLHYDISANYSHFQDRNKNTEHGINVGAAFQHYIRGQIIGLEIGYDYFNNTRVADTSNWIIRANPWITKADDEWRVMAGFNVYYDYYGGTGKTYFHPLASLEFSLVKDYVVPYVGVDGNLNINNYGQTALENFYIVPGLRVGNSNNKINLYAGVKGNITRNISFNGGGAYRVVDNMHFYINDTVSEAANKFLVVYDDIEKFHYWGELKASIGNSFEIMLKADKYRYEMKLQEHPWHKPETELSFSARYNLRGKILLSADIFHIGERKAKSRLPEADPFRLDGVTDFNLGVEYRYNNLFSAFIKANNITSSGYRKWNYYPVQGFNFLAGFTYSL